MIKHPALHEKLSGPSDDSTYDLHELSASVNKSNAITANLTPKHGAWGNFHVMPKLKIRCKGQRLRHRLAADLAHCADNETVLFTHYISKRLE